MTLLIGFAGHIASGKSFVASNAKSRIGGVQVQFATPLYEILNKFDPAIFEGMTQEAKLEPFAMKPEWSRREALQKFGTEIIRHQINMDAWIDIFKRTVGAWHRQEVPVLCADVRFPNEIDVIREMGGIVVWLSRPSTEVQTMHISGNAIGPEHCDAIIDNSYDVNRTIKDVFEAWNAHVKACA